MSFSFLCSSHREWVYFQPTEAMAFLFESQETGEYLLQQSRWQEAMNFIGSALEVADIMLEQGFANASSMVPRFTSLSLILTGIYARLGESANSDYVLQHCHRRLHEIPVSHLSQRSQRLLAQCQELVKEQLVDIAVQERRRMSAALH